MKNWLKIEKIGYFQKLLQIAIQKFHACKDCKIDSKKKRIYRNLKGINTDSVYHLLNGKYTVCKHNSPLIIYVRKQCIIKIDCNHINILMRSDFINDAMNNFKAESIYAWSP